MALLDPDMLQTSGKRKSNLTVDTSSSVTVQKCAGSLFIVTYGSMNCAPFCLLFLVPNSMMSLHGRAKLTVVGGPPVTILGAVLHGNVNKSYRLYSPNSHASLVINQVGKRKLSSHEVNVELCLVQLLRTRHSDVYYSEIRTVLENENMLLTDEISILLFETLDCRVTSSLLYVKRFKNLFSFPDSSCIPNSTSLSKSLGFAFSESGEDGGFRITEEMLAATDKVNALLSRTVEEVTFDDNLLGSNSFLSFHQRSTCLVVGPKGSGKSSFIRFILNRCLTNSADKHVITNCVAVLDCDIGQPEFTPCGMVSLTLVSQPVFGPPFSHHVTGVAKVIRQCFIGSVTPSDDPEFYINSLKYVYESYTTLPDPKPPLLVNTMGWTQGLGITLLVEQILLVRPKLIIQLQLHEHQPGFRQNLPLLDHATLRGLQGWNYQSLAEEAFDHESIIVSSATASRRHRPSVQLQHSWGAPDHRDLTLVSYLTASLAEAQTSLPAHSRSDALGHPVAHLLDCIPYRVPLVAETGAESRQLGIRILQPTSNAFQEPVDSLALDVDQVMACLNATLVGLCAVPKHLIGPSLSHPNSWTVIRENPVCECLGLAVCRAVDPSKKLLYLTTGVLEEDLLRVTGIVRGNVNLPQSYFLEQPVMPCRSDAPAPSAIPYLGPSETQGQGRAGLPARRSYPKTQHHCVHRTGSYEQR